MPKPEELAKGSAGALLHLVSGSVKEVARVQVTLVRLPLAGAVKVLALSDALRRQATDAATRRLMAALPHGEEHEPSAPSAWAHAAAAPATDEQIEQIEQDEEPAAGFAPAPTAPGEQDEEPAAGFAPAPAATNQQDELAAGFAPAPTDPVDAAVARLTGLPTEDELPQPATSADQADPAGSGDADIVTRAVEAAAHHAPTEEIERVDLPIPDFDHLTLGSLRGRLRMLDLDQLAILRSYEQEHARRLPILTMLENRIAKLEAGSTG